MSILLLPLMMAMPVLLKCIHSAFYYELDLDKDDRFR